MKFKEPLEKEPLEEIIDFLFEWENQISSGEKRTDHIHKDWWDIVSGELLDACQTAVENQSHTHNCPGYLNKAIKDISNSKERFNFILSYDREPRGDVLKHHWLMFLTHLVCVKELCVSKRSMSSQRDILTIVTRIKEEIKNIIGTEPFEEPYGDAFLRGLCSMIAGMYPIPLSHSEPEQKILFPLVDTDNQEGLIAEGKFYTVNNKHGGIFIAPNQAFIAMDHAFRNSFFIAKKFVTRFLESGKKYGDICIRLDPYNPEREAPFYYLTGNSFGGALALALLATWLKIDLKTDWVISFSLTRQNETIPDGNCYGVGYVVEKAIAIKEVNLSNFLVSEDDWNKFKNIRNIKLHSTKTFQDAFSKCTVISELENYLEKVKIEKEKKILGIKPLKTVERRVRILSDSQLDTDDKTGVHDEENSPPVIMEWGKYRKKIKRALIVGGAGIGKSYLLEAEAEYWAKDGLEKLKTFKNIDQIIIPVRLELKELGASLKNASEFFVALKNVVGDKIQSVFFDANTSKTSDETDNLELFVKKRLGTGNILLLLDAMDEVEPNESLLPKLSNWLEENRKNGIRCYITSRDYIHNFNLDNSPEEGAYELLPLDNEQIKQSISNQFEDEPDIGKKMQTWLESPRSWGLAEIPIWLNLMCNVASEELILERMNRTSIFDSVIKIRLIETSPQLNYLSDDELKYLFGSLAYEFLLKDKKEFNERNILNNFVKFRSELILREAWEQFIELKKFINELFNPEVKIDFEKAIFDAVVKHSEVKKRTYLEEIVNTMLLVVEQTLSGELTYKFPHQTFQEYFTACWIADHNRLNKYGWDKAKIPVNNNDFFVKELLDKKAWDPKWQDIFIFIAGKLRENANPADQEKFLRMIRKPIKGPQKDDTFRHRLALAVFCVLEMFIPDHGEKNQAREEREEIFEEAFEVWRKYHIKDMGDLIPYLDKSLKWIFKSISVDDGFIKTIVKEVEQLIDNKNIVEQLAGFKLILNLNLNVDPKIYLPKLIELIKTSRQRSRLNKLLSNIDPDIINNEFEKILENLYKESNGIYVINLLDRIGHFRFRNTFLEKFGLEFRPDEPKKSPKSTMVLSNNGIEKILHQFTEVDLKELDEQQKEKLRENLDLLRRSKIPNNYHKTIFSHLIKILKHEYDPRDSSYMEDSESNALDIISRLHLSNDMSKELINQFKHLLKYETNKDPVKIASLNTLQKLNISYLDQDLFKEIFKLLENPNPHLKEKSISILRHFMTGTESIRIFGSSPKNVEFFLLGNLTKIDD